MSTSVTPFRLEVPQSDIEDLQQRLRRTRWPDRETADAWEQGVPLAKARELVEYWLHRYDWRRCEAALNRLPQFTTEIEGLRFHFIHLRSPHAGARPLLMTHGWPGSVLEFMRVMAPLTDPTRFGGRQEDAFHLVLPTLPGFGFSDKPAQPGWGVNKIASAWAALMNRLGYERYLAQGGDWGSVVTTMLGVQKPAGLKGIHLNLPLVLPRDPGSELSAAEKAMLEQVHYYAEWDSGYSHQQSTRPQTLGYALADSPVGQAMWIYEKFHRWTDADGEPAAVFGYDALLDIISSYWFSNSAASSARIYWESYKNVFFAQQLDLPVGCSIFPKELYRAPRSWAQRCMSKLVYWNELDKGGHFAAFEQPELFVQELRAWARCISD